MFTTVRASEVESEEYFTTGDRELDLLFNGGIRLLSITELVGQSYVPGLPSLRILADEVRSASSKSQLALQLAVTVQMPFSKGGLGGGTLVISSEGIIASPRLLSIAERFGDASYLDNIYFIKAQDIETLIHLLDYQLPHSIDTIREQSLLTPTTLPIKLIILDSIAAPFRVAHETNNGGFIQRSKDMGAVIDKLKRLAGENVCAVVVVNQVSDVFDERGGSKIFGGTIDPFDDEPHPSPSTSSPPHPPAPATATAHPPPLRRLSKNLPHIAYSLPPNLYNKYQNPHFSGQSATHGSQAALGYSWANLVGTRIMLERTQRRRMIRRSRRAPSNGVAHVENGMEEGDDGGEEEEVLIRKMSMIFSPYAPRGEVDFITAEGGISSYGTMRLLEERGLPQPMEEDDD